jgi:integrase
MSERARTDVEGRRKVGLVQIPGEIADEIRAQQRHARERVASTPWLLPAERANREGGKHIDDGEVRRRLRRWVLACDIREQSGRPIEFKPHRLRHTIATELINRGMSKTGIQSCPHPNACHSCAHFLTDERYRPVLEKQLTRAEQRAADAERVGHERLAEINRPEVLDLRRIIAGLDRLGE